MDSTTKQHRRSSRNGYALLLIAAVFVLALSPFVANAGSSLTGAGQTVTDLTEIELPSSLAVLDAFAALGVASKPADRPGYLHADVTEQQRAALDQRGITYEKGDSFVLIEGKGLSAEASVVGFNSNNVSIVANDTVYSHATVSGAPPGKTVIRADVAVTMTYPEMCNIYIMVFHPSNAMWFHAWNGNQHACTANLNQQWNGIHDFDFADINGQWHLQVQETGGKTQGFIDSWSIRLYYQADATATPTRTTTPTRTVTPSVRKLFLPLIVSEP